MGGALPWLLDVAGGWSWWPAVDGARAWDWGFRLYPAAFAAALSPTAGYALIVWRRRWRGREMTRRRVVCFAGAVLALLVALCWPLGTLATVMLSARTVQYLLVTLAAAPLLLLGIPRWTEEGRGWLRRWSERIVGSPRVGAPLLGLVVIVTHTGGVVDAETDPLLSAAIRGAWLAAALVFWWPLVGPGPERERLPYLGALGYLVLPFLFPKLPAAVYVFSESPLYTLYAGALRPGGLTDRADQGLAGFLLWLPGSAMVVTATWLLFRHWSREDQRLKERDSLAVPANPAAIDRLVQVPGAWQALEDLLRAVDEALPSTDTAADLDFDVAPDGPVTLVVRLHASPALEVLVRDRLRRAYAAYLERAGPRRAGIEARLRVEVEGHGSRVQ